MGFYKCECRVVHLGRNSCTHQSRRGADLLEKSSAQKDHFHLLEVILVSREGEVAFQGRPGMLPRQVDNLGERC